MAEFTSGERRGLTGLIVILCIVSVFFFLSNRCNSESHEIIDQGASSDFISTSIVSDTTDTVAVPASKKKKTKKEKKKPARTFRERNPLDEPINEL